MRDGVGCSWPDLNAGKDEIRSSFLNCLSEAKRLIADLQIIHWPAFISGNDFRAFFLILFRDSHGQIDNCFWHYMGHTLRDRLITAAHHSEGMTRERKQFQKQETRAGETGSRDGPSFSRTLWGKLRICTQQKYKHTTFFYSHVSLVEVKDLSPISCAEKYYFSQILST